MHVPQTEPIVRRTYDAAELMANHPPALRHANKQLVYQIACPPGCRHTGQIVYSRWPAMSLPDTVPLPVRPDLVEPRECVFDYAQADSPTVEWHVNFADPSLFGFYAGALFAQDEVQVAEHPALAAVREALLAERLPAVTVERGCPTPVLVAGVQRRCRIQSGCNAEGRSGGIYGQRFGTAGADEIRKAVQAVDPPTLSNILAIAALNGGSGAYTQQDIRYTLQTAYTGFAAAKIESAGLAGPQARTVIHTGWWGCGAFGGNRTLMAMLQVIAARLARVDRLVFHTVHRSSRSTLEHAMDLLEREVVPRGEPTSLDHAMKRVLDMKFDWGEGNST